MLNPSSVMIRRAARPGSSVGSTAAGCTMFFQSRCSGRKVTQGLMISMNEKPGCRMPWAMMSAVPCWSPEKARATKLAPAASAITGGLKGRMPVPPGESLLSQSGSVVGDAWPLVMP